MSVEGESLAFDDETVDPDHDVDPADVDWYGIFEGYAGSDGLLDGSTRVDVISSEVDGIENARQAEALLSEAATEGLLEERGGDYYLDDVTAAKQTVTDIDWRTLFEEVAGDVTAPLPDYTARNVLIQSHLGLGSEEEADAIVTAAKDRGVITNTTIGEETGFFLTDALEQAHESATSEQTAEPEVEPTTDETPAADRGTDDDQDSGKQPDPETMERGELEAEVRSLRNQVGEMESRFDAMATRMDTITEAVFGQDSVPGDVDKSEDMLTKFVDLQGRVDEHDEKLSMVSDGGGSRSTPDERAMGLRTALYDEATKSGEKKAMMTRDQAKFALNGGLSRAQLLDAMRRAADGNSEDINGRSDLEPVEGLKFVNGTGRGDQSKIQLDLSRTSGEELRTKFDS